MLLHSFHSRSCLQPRPDHWGRGLRGSTARYGKETLTNNDQLLMFSSGQNLYAKHIVQCHVIECYIGEVYQ